MARRDTARRETIAAIRRIAMEQLAESGAGGISMKAIAQRLGMSGPALFRYVPNRDALITDLVHTAYHDLADTLSPHTHAATPADVEPAIRAQADAVRTWALAHPHAYMLIFGTSIPGYHAPEEVMEPLAERLLEALVGPLLVLPTDIEDRSTGAVAALIPWAQANDAPGLSPMLWYQAFASWTRLHGILSLEIAGHFGPRLPDPTLLYEAEVDALVEMLRPWLP